MSSHIYDNLPLKPLNKEDKENLPDQKIKTVQNIFAFPTDSKQKKRKSSPEIAKVSPQSLLSKRPKSSKSVSEMFYKNHFEVNENGQNDEFGSSETLRASNGVGKMNNDNGSSEDWKKGINVHSTPTSTMDDGYESSNSTPLVSGNFLYTIHFSCLKNYNNSCFTGSLII